MRIKGIMEQPGEQPGAEALPLLQAFFDASSIPFEVFEPDGRCRRWNRAFVELFGSAPSPTYNILEDDTLGPGSLALIQHAFRGEPCTLSPTWYDPREHPAGPREGRRVAISATFFPLKDRAGRVECVATAFKDLTAEWSTQELVKREREQLNHALMRIEGLARKVQESEEWLRETLAAAQVGTWEWIVPENKVLWSSNIEQIMGLRPGDFGGTYEAWLSLVHPDDQGRMAGQVESAIRGGTGYEAEFRFLRADGSTGWQAARGYCILDEAGKARSLRGVMVDITELKRAEQLTRQQAEFERQLIGIVSHDLKNPLNAIQVSASLLLRRGKLDDRQARSVGHILTSSERANRLIADFLDFTRARKSGGGVPVEPVPLGFAELVRQVVEEIQLARPDREIRVHHRGEDGLQGDPGRLAQVVSNLVENAAQHSPVEAKVAVCSYSDAEEMTLEVFNEGPPIPAEDVPRLFQPFRQGHSITRSGRSLGLGLYITREIVAAHGGRVGVKSGEEGTVFTVVLPRVNGAASAAHSRE